MQERGCSDPRRDALSDYYSDALMSGAAKRVSYVEQTYIYMREMMLKKKTAYAF